MSTRIKLICALIVVAATIGVLVDRAVTKAATFYLTVSELNQEGSQGIGQEVTVSGNIVGSSIEWNPQTSLLQFSIQDTANSKPLPIQFHGPKPDDFENNWPVIVTGQLHTNGTFYAEKLLIKCPSKYKTKEETYTASPQN